MILGIETSCDETAVAIVDKEGHLKSSVVASQTDLHAQYGGVFPEVAARVHIEVIGAVYQEALQKAKLTLDDINVIAVTRGPGLVGSLLVGVNFGKGLAIATGKPIIGINHLEGHIYSLWIDQPHPIDFPVVNLIVSGGHTELVLMTAHGQYQHLGGTIDDAAGEAFDKVGRLLELPYPGGPSIQKAAMNGNPTAYDFPRAMMQEPNYDFSFSGLKTAVLRAVRPSVKGRKIQRGEQSLKQGELRDDISIADIAASFQAAVVDVLVQKTIQAARDFKAKAILISGGVSANQRLRQQMETQADIPVYYPPLKYCTDNAAMIATAAYYRYQEGQDDGLDFDVLPTWPLEQISASNVV
ncbi:MAG: tRNA (adenosine(37)-N6)-threonylcarbamoyltransferase complex transferase subunit TsaD [Phototrophicales bacterium]|nr:MAG: tRNA (adenosine(37)-N6)-threonylcarbamoyltransferase complex transferase subunit TsaD [Phototrophicales bacterium]